jgi:hypothetical protein
MLGNGQQKHREGFVSKTIRRVSSGFAFGSSVSPDDNPDDSDEEQLSNISEDSFTEDEADDSDDEMDVINFIGYTQKKKDHIMGTGNTADIIAPPPTSSPMGGPLSGRKRLLSGESSRKHEYVESSDDDEDDYHDPENPTSTLAIANILQTTQTRLGRPSSIIKDAGFLANHIIVSGCDSNFQIFVDEIRRPSANGEAYHPVLIVHEHIPVSWNYLVESYNDVYYYSGTITNMSSLNKLNVKNAFSVALMSARTAISTVDEVHVNTETLFTFLKLEQHIPPGVHVTVELTSPSNMAVLNATIMRRIRETLESQSTVSREQTQRGKEANHATGSNSDKTVSFNTTEVNSPPNSRNSSRANSPKREPRDSQNQLSAANINSLTPAELKSMNKGTDRRRVVIFDGNGRFATKRTDSVHNLFRRGISTKDLKDLTTASARKLEATKEESSDRELERVEGRLAGRGRKRRSSTFGLVASAITNLVATDEVANNVLAKFYNENMEDVWDAMDSHHVLPVFASAKAFVPASFESLLVQSFYLRLTPVICEKFVVGQLGQTMSSFTIPRQLIGKSFLDVFRLFIVRHAQCFHEVIIIIIHRPHMFYCI